MSGAVAGHTHVSRARDGPDREPIRAATLCLGIVHEIGRFAVLAGLDCQGEHLFEVNNFLSIIE